MSAAATAAGYLYASGRLRAKKEEAEKAERGEAHIGKRGEAHTEKRGEAPRRQIKVAVYQPADQQPTVARRQPKIEYKTKRSWKPE
jgi:hypothetical protein